MAPAPSWCSQDEGFCSLALGQHPLFVDVHAWLGRALVRLNSPSHGSHVWCGHSVKHLWSTEYQHPARGGRPAPDVSSCSLLPQLSKTAVSIQCPPLCRADAQKLCSVEWMKCWEKLEFLPASNVVSLVLWKMIVPRGKEHIQGANFSF